VFKSGDNKTNSANISFTKCNEHTVQSSPRWLTPSTIFQLYLIQPASSHHVKLSQRIKTGKQLSQDEKSRQKN
jgi:hypothetical protein